MGQEPPKKVEGPPPKTLKGTLSPTQNKLRNTPKKLMACEESINAKKWNYSIKARLSKKT